MKKNTSVMYAKKGEDVRTVHFDAINFESAWRAALGMIGRRDGLLKTDFVELHFTDPQKNGAVLVRSHGTEPEHQPKKPTAAPYVPPSPPAKPASTTTAATSPSATEQRVIFKRTPAALTIKRPLFPYKKAMLVMTS